MPGAWLAPDTPAHDAPASLATLTVLDTLEGDRPVHPQRLAAPTRPMTVTDVLDGSIALIKSAPAPILTIAAATVVPLELVGAWINRDSLEESGLSSAFRVGLTGGTTHTEVTAATVVLFIVSGVLLSIVAGAIASLVSASYVDRRLSAGEALSAALRRTPALLIAWLAVHVCEAAATIAFIVPVLFVIPLFAVVAPAIVLEQLGPFAGMRRSIQLSRRRLAPMLGAVLLIAVSDAVLTVAISGIALLFTGFSFGWIIEAVAAAASSLITVPFVAGAATLLYFDLRIRAEGLDLELAVADHFSDG